MPSSLVALPSPLHRIKVKPPVCSKFPVFGSYDRSGQLAADVCAAPLVFESKGLPFYKLLAAAD